MTATYEAAAGFAARINRAIDAMAETRNAPADFMHRDADRLHVKAFLRAFQRAEEGLRDHSVEHECFAPVPDHGTDAPLSCADAARWTEARDEAWDGLVRVGSTYGEKP